MGSFIPFIHFLKEIVVNYQLNGTVPSLPDQPKSQRVDKSYKAEKETSTRASKIRKRKTPISKLCKEKKNCPEPFKSVKCCGFTFNYRSRYKNHLASSSHLKALKCRICQQTFKEESDLQSHKKGCTAPEPFKSVKCCGYTFDAPSHYKIHLTSARHLKVFKCRVCKQTFKEESDHQSHKKGCKAPPKKRSILKQKADGTFQPVECCGRTFYYLSHLKRHQSRLSHQSIYKCKLFMCKADFSSKESLENHRQEVHSLINGKWHCELCNKYFTTNGMLARHRACIHYKTEIFECDMCLFKANRKEILARHIKRKHLNTSDYVCCDTCGRLFHNNSALASHIRNIHDKNRLQCTICAKGFDDHELFEYHKKTHLPGNQFFCQVCGKSFKTYLKREEHFVTHTRVPQRGKRSKKSLSKRNIKRDDKHVISETREAKDSREELNCESNERFQDSHPMIQCSDSCSDVDVEKISDTESVINIRPVQKTCRILPGIEDLKPEDFDIEDSILHSQTEAKEENNRSPIFNIRRKDLIHETPIKSCPEDHHSTITGFKKSPSFKLFEGALGICDENISSASKVSKKSNLNFESETNGNTSSFEDRLHTSVNSVALSETLCSPSHGKAFKTLTEESSSCQDPSATVESKKKLSDKSMLVTETDQTEEARIQCVPHFQTSFGQYHNIRNSPTESCVPENTSWLTELISKSHEVKKPRNKSVTPLQRKSKGSTRKSVSQSPNSKLRRRIKHIITQNKGPKVFMTRLVGDDSDVFLLPEFFAEDCFENLAPEDNSVEDVIIRSDVPSLPRDKNVNEVGSSEKGLTASIEDTSSASNVIPLLLVSSFEH